VSGGTFDNLYTQPFALDEELTLPDGKRVRGTLARVYSLLVHTARRQHRHRVGLAFGPPGWVPAYLFRAAWAGGEAGDRRRRDLRELHGIEIEMQRFERDGEETATTLYRLAPEQPGRASSSPQAPADRSTSQASSTGATLAATAARLAPAAATSSTTQVEQEAGPAAAAGHAPAPTGLAGVVTATRPERFGARRAPLRFYCHTGTVVGAPAINCNPGDHGAPSWAAARAIPARVVRGELSEQAATDLYLAQLRRAYVAGDLDAVLEREDGPLVLWVYPGLAWSPLPALVRALTACGAEHLGDWSERGKVAA
jgi:hypothetical protein